MNELDGYKAMYKNVEAEPARVGLQDLPKGLRSILEGNPYYVFGIPSNAGQSAAKEVIRKLEPLQKLGKSGAYKPAVDLAGVEKPDRGKKAMSIALSGLSDPEKVWLWFTDDTWCGYEKGKTYKSQNWLCAEPLAVCPEDAAGSVAGYDAFLAAYMSLLMHDPKLEDAMRWKCILDTLEFLCSCTKHGMPEPLKDRFAPDDTHSEDERAMSLKSAVLRPVLSAVNALDPVHACALLSEPVWSGKGYCFQGELDEAIARRATGWVDDAVRPLEALNKEIDKKPSDVTEEEAGEIFHALADFEQKYWQKFKETYLALPQESPYQQRISEKVGNTINYLRVKMSVRKERESAHFYSICYPYICERLIAKENVWKRYDFEGYPLNWVELAPEYFTTDQLGERAVLFKADREYDRVGDMYHELVVNRKELSYGQEAFDLYWDLGERKKAERTLLTIHEILTRDIGNASDDALCMAVGLYLQADLVGLETGLHYYRELASSGGKTGRDQLAESYSFLMKLLTAPENVSYVDYAVDAADSGSPYRKVQTFYLLNKGLERGELTAYSYLGLCRRQTGYGCCVDDKKAVQYFRRGEREGDVKSLMMMAMSYYYGEGLPQDQDKGLLLLYDAIDKGSEEAAGILKEIQAKDSGARIFRLPKDQKVNLIYGDGYFRCYVRRVDYAAVSKAVKLRLWLLNLHNRTVDFTLVFKETLDIDIPNGRCLTLKPREIRSIELEVPEIEWIRENELAAFRMQVVIYDAEPFCGKIRRLSFSDMFTFMLDGLNGRIIYSAAGGGAVTNVRKLAVSGSRARRIREKNALEIAFGSARPAQNVVDMLESCGYRKARLRQTWTYVYKDEKSLSDAERLAGLITGGYIAD